jgi:hypothetical protein
MKDDDDFPDKFAAEVGFLIGVIGICAILLALVLGEMYGWLVY